MLLSVKQWCIISPLFYKTKEDLKALLLKTPIINDFSNKEFDEEKIDKYISENMTDEGILLIRRYYGITAIK